MIETASIIPPKNRTFLKHSILLWRVGIMKVLIIATDREERLRQFDKEPKSLTSLLGLRLIERVILSAKEAGLKDFVIVTGYLGEKIKRFLGNGSKYGVKLSYIENDLWEKGEAISAYKARNLLKDDFILLMSNHIFNPEILADLKRYKLENGECMLCVDASMKYITDINEAIKVKVVDGKITDVGKDLKEYDGVDMGILLCTHHIFEVLKKNIEIGRYALIEAVKEQAKEGKVKAYLVDGEKNYWLKIDTLEDLKLAEKMLLFEASKHAIATRILYKYLNTPITKILTLTPITPNQVTLLSLTAGVAASLLFTYSRPILAGFLALLSSVLDGVDGKIARIKFQKTTYGGIFDSFIDLYIDFAIFFGMAYYGYRSTQNLWLWLLAFFALTGTIAVSVPAGISTTTKKYWISLSKLYRCQPFHSRFGSIDRWIVECFPSSKDMRYLWIFIGSILRQVIFTLWAIALATNIMAVYRLLRAKITTENLSVAEIEERLERIYAS